MKKDWLIEEGCHLFSYYRGVFQWVRNNKLTTRFVVDLETEEQFIGIANQMMKERG